MPKLFEKGNPGRPKGTLNKANQEIKEKFQALLDGVGIEQLVEDLNSLEPVQRLNIIIGIAEFIVPKLARQNQVHEFDDSIDGFTIEVKRNRDES